MRRLYLDTVAVVYIVEKPPIFGVLAEEKLFSLGTVEIVSSEFVRLESLPKPTATNNPSLADFEAFFEEQIVIWSPFNRIVIDRAIHLTAKYGCKPLDSVHLASAIETNCDLFLTNDHRLKRVTEITVLLIQE